MSWTTGQLYLRRDAMVQFGCHGRSWETRQSLSLKSRRCVECVASVLYPVLPCIDYQLLRFLWSRSDRFQGLCEVPPSCSLVSFRRCGLSHTSLRSWPLIVKSKKHTKLSDLRLMEPSWLSHSSAIATAIALLGIKSSSLYMVLVTLPSRVTAQYRSLTERFLKSTFSPCLSLVAACSLSGCSITSTFL